MPHCDDQTLALLALGEPAESPDDALHIAECEACHERLNQLRESVVLGRRGPVDLIEPPERVWDSIRAQVSADDQPTSIAEAAGRRRSRMWAVLGAAAAVIVVAGSFTLGRQMTAPPQLETLATAQLDRLPDSALAQGASGTAVLHRGPDGYSVEVTTAGLASPSGFYEVWLMKPDASGLVAVGTMSSSQSHAEFPVPDSVVADDFTMVDISDEPLDGDPGHSADSVLRGQLTV